MKHILTVDVQKKGDIYSFTLHHHKKATVLKANSLYDGFVAVEQIVKDGWVQNDEIEIAD